MLSCYLRGQPSGYIIVHMRELGIEYVEGELHCEEGQA